uniref:Organic cation transporter-like protein 2 n=1 Tax=Coturnix japonica TaxID=93934 RepID=A0A8C2U507_COTJA
MSGKSSPEGEEGAGRMKSESWGQSNAVGEVRRGRVILAAYLIVTLELTLLFMQFGVVPYLAKNLGLDSVGFGYLQTTFGVLQLVGGPIFGRFADQFGSRAALTLSCASASAFFLLLSISTSIPILFLSRLPTVFMHGLPGAQKVITDLTAPSERAAALGKLGLCFGVGIIIGSALGGVLSTKFGYLECPIRDVKPQVALLALGTALTSCPHPTPGVPNIRQPQHSSPVAAPSSLPCYSHRGHTDVFFSLTLPLGLFMIMFSIISIEFFGLEAVESGYLMSYFGVLQMVVQGLVIGKLTSHCTEQTLLRFSILLFAGVGLGMALMRTVWHYCIIVVPLVFAFNVQGTITDSILTKAVPSSDTGAMLGICASVQPLTRTVGPTLGVILYRQFGVSSFGYLQLIVNAGLFVYLLKRKSPLRETKSH